MIDTGYITKDDAISIVQDRTNHVNDNLIYDFWNNYINYCSINNKVLDLIKKLKDKGYKIYLLSNINSYVYNSIHDSELFDIVDGVCFIIFRTSNKTIYFYI